MATSTAQSNDIPPIKPKRQLFKNRPAWAVQVGSTHSPHTVVGAEEEEDTFSRSKEAYARAEKAKALAREAEQKKLRDAKGKGKPRETTGAETGNGVRSPKRRRLSSDLDESHWSGDHARVDRTPPASPSNPATPIPALDQPTSHLQSPKSQPTMIPTFNDPIVIDMSDDEDVVPPQRHSPPIPPSRAPDSPRKTNSVPAAHASSTIAKPSANGGSVLDGEDDLVVLDDQSLSATLLSTSNPIDTTETLLPRQTTTTTSTSFPRPTPLPTSPLPDPILHLLIHSPQFPSTRPLITKIRLSTRLKAVREAWIKYQSTPAPPATSLSSPPPSSDATATPSPVKNATQGPPLPENAASEIFLTFRRRRVFDFTTCRSLGLTVNTSGDVVLSGKVGAGLSDEVFGGGDGDDGEAQVQMEAVTAEWIDGEVERKAREEALRNGGGVGAAGATIGEHKPGNAAAKEEKSEQIRVIIKAKGLEDYKLRVRPTTTIAQILRIFRKYRPVPGDAMLVLMFEGERLGEDVMVKDSEVVDLDVLEVYVR